MKNRTILLSSIFILGATSLIYALQTTAKDKIIQGFNSGKAELIASFCDETSFLELFNIEEYEGQENIENRLSDFFKIHPPLSFEVRHQGGKEHKNKEYLVGILQCQHEVFRITLAIHNGVLSNIDIIFEPPAG